MCNVFDVSAQAVFAAIGPGIGRCCYEVDASAEPFLTQFAADVAVYRPSRPGHLYLDLQQAILLQLYAAGVPSTQVWSANPLHGLPSRMVLFLPSGRAPFGTHVKRRHD